MVEKYARVPMGTSNNLGGFRVSRDTVCVLNPSFAEMCRRTSHNMSIVDITAVG